MRTFSDTFNIWAKTFKFNLSLNYVLELIVR